MKSGFVFFKKELKSILKTYRIWLVPLIFVFFGILSPVTAKYTPLLLKAAMQSSKTQQGMVVQIALPTPTAASSYAEWLKNLSQLGMLALILFSMGLITQEKSSGTLALVLTKPISRSAVVVSKFLAQAGFIALSMAAGMTVCYLYTLLLFEKAPFTPLALSSVAFAVYALLIMAVTVFFSALMKRGAGAGGLALLVNFVLIILASLGQGLEKYSPGALFDMAYGISGGTQAFSKIYPAVGLSLAASIGMIIAASLVLKRREI